VTLTCDVIRHGPDTRYAAVLFRFRRDRTELCQGVLAQRCMKGSELAEPATELKNHMPNVCGK